MNKSSILALLTALLMMVSLVASAENADDPAVIKYGESVYTLSEVQEMYDSYYQQNVDAFEEAGMTFTSDDVIALRDQLVAVLAENIVLMEKARELGYDQITEEDEAALREEVETSFEAEVQAYADSIGASVEETMTLLEAQGITLDYIYEQSLLNLPYDRLYDHYVQDTQVTDEDIQKEYDAYVEEDKATYEGNVASYEMNTYYYGSDGILYVPEGFRYVKQILLATPDDIASELMDFETDMSALQTEINALYDELYMMENVQDEDDAAAAEAEAEATAAAEAEATAAPRTEEEVNAELETKQATYDELQAKYDDLRATILPSLKPIIDEINTKLQDGASFDDLITEYNTDPGMVAGAEGYKVHKESVLWDTTFRDYAMALENAGDLSAPFLTDFGIHILQYVDDVPSGPVEMTSEVAEQLRESLQGNVQDEAFYALFEQWLAEAEVETYPELIVLPEAPAPEATEPASEDEGEAPEPNEEDVQEEDSIG